MKSKKAKDSNKKNNQQRKAVVINMYFPSDVSDEEVHEKLTEALEKIKDSVAPEINIENHVESKKKQCKFLRILRAPFICKKRIKNRLDATNSLISASLSSFFQLVSFISLLAVLLNGYLVVEAIHNCQGITTIISVLFFGVFAVVLYILSGVFRISSIEIEKNKDSNYLATLFAGVVTLVSVIISLISVIK